MTLEPPQSPSISVVTTIQPTGSNASAQAALVAVLPVVTGMQGAPVAAIPTLGGVSGPSVADVFSAGNTATVVDGGPLVVVTRSRPPINRFGDNILNACTFPFTPEGWKGYAERGKSREFVIAIDAFVKWIYLKLAGFVAGNQPNTDISNFYEKILWPHEMAIFETRNSMKLEPAFSRQFHDSHGRLIAIRNLCNNCVRNVAGALDSLRAAVTPSSTRAPESLVDRLSPAFRQHGSVNLVNQYPGIAFAKDISIDDISLILENLIRNAMEHPHIHHGQALGNTVYIDIAGNQIIVLDKGSGMDAAMVENLKGGVRVHDGRPVTEGLHGHGWENIRGLCEKLGIRWDIESESQSTRVILTLPPNFWDFEPQRFDINGTKMFESPHFPAFVGTLTPAARLEVARQAFGITDNMWADFVRDLGELVARPSQEDASNAFQDFRTRWMKIYEMGQRLNVAYQKDMQGDLYRMAEIFGTSQMQPLAGISQIITQLSAYLGFAINEDLRSYPLAQTRDSPRYYKVGDKLVYASPATAELAFGFLTALYKDESEIKWLEDGSLEITHPRGWRLHRKYEPFSSLIWPDNLNGFVVNTTLDALGWKMGVKEKEGGAIVARIDFGKTKVEWNKTDKLKIVKQAFDEVDEMWMEYQRSWRELVAAESPEAVIAKYQDIKLRLAEGIAQWESSYEVAKEGLSPQDLNIADRLHVSQLQTINVLRNELYILEQYIALRKDLKSRKVSNSEYRFEIGGKTLTFSKSRAELASGLLHVLTRGFTFNWNHDNSLEVNHPIGWRTNRISYPLFHDLAWPADMARPEITETLEVLGWQMAVKENGDGTATVRINFGNTKIED